MKIIRNKLEASLLLKRCLKAEKRFNKFNIDFYIENNIVFHHEYVQCKLETYYQGLLFNNQKLKDNLSKAILLIETLEVQIEEMKEKQEHLEKKENLISLLID